MREDHERGSPSTPARPRKANHTARRKHGRRTAVGFVAMMRTPDIEDLIEVAPLAFTLAAAIAIRTRYMPGESLKGVRQGEALIGDHKSYGMSRQQYRTALGKLVRWEYVTIKTTRKGTIARLMDTRLFDVLNVARCEQANQQGNHQPTISQPLSNKGTMEQWNKVTETAARRGSRPLSVSEVVDHAVENAVGALTPEWIAWLESLNLDRPAGVILADITHDGTRECVLRALRFVRYNNERDWPLHSWRAAFGRFDATCNGPGGVSDLPEDWTPTITSP